jgi:FkbM family methyltransferase
MPTPTQMHETSKKNISPFTLTIAGVLLATIVALSLALNHSADLIARLQDKVAAGVPRFASTWQPADRSPGKPDAVVAMDVAQAVLEIDRQVPDPPDRSITYYQTKFGTAHLRVVGRGQRIPLHTHRTASSATVIVSGAPRVTHRFRRRGRIASLTASYPPGSVFAAAAMTGEEWVNATTDHTQASLVFSVPPNDGDFYLAPDHDEAITGASPTVLDIAAQLARLHAAGKAIAVESFGPLGERMASVAVAAASELGPFPDPALLYVVRGRGTLRAERDMTVKASHLLALRPHTRLGVVPSGGESPLVMLLFRPENDGASDIIKKGKKLYSQYDEELVIREFFQDRKAGFFVDIGAGDYQHYSTTFYLEERLGWKGIAVDALASYASGYAEHRPRTTFLNYLVTDRAKGKQKFYEATGLTEISSVDKQVAEEQLRLLKNEAPVVELEVPTTTLTEVLERQKVGRIDLLSMDIEEHEPQALAGFDIDRFKPELVCVEAHPSVRNQLLRYFTGHGYVRIDKFLPYDELNWYFTPRHASSP